MKDGNLDSEPRNIDGKHEKRSDVFKLREIDRDSRLPTYVIESKLIQISEDLDGKK